MPRLKNSKKEEAGKSLLPIGNYVTYPDPKQNIISVKLTESCVKEIKKFSKIESGRKIKLTVINGELLFCIPKTSEGYQKFILKSNLVANQSAKGCLQSYKLGYSSSAYPHLYCFGAIQTIYKVTANQDSFANFRKSQNRVKKKESKSVTKLIGIDSIKNPVKKLKNANQLNKRKKYQKDSSCNLNQKIVSFKEKQKQLTEGPPVKKQKMKKMKSPKFVHKKFDKGKALNLYDDPIRYIVVHLLFIKPLSFNEISNKLSQVVGDDHKKKLSKILSAISTKHQSDQESDLYKLKVSFNASINSNWLGYTPEEKNIAFDMIHKVSPMSLSDSENNEQISNIGLEEKTNISTFEGKKITTFEDSINSEVVKECKSFTNNHIQHSQQHYENNELGEENISKESPIGVANCDLLPPVLSTNNLKNSIELSPTKTFNEKPLSKVQSNSFAENNDKSSYMKQFLTTELANDNIEINNIELTAENNSIKSLQTQKFTELQNPREVNKTSIRNSFINQTTGQQSKSMDVDLNIKTIQKQTVRDCSIKNYVLPSSIENFNRNYRKLSHDIEKERKVCVNNNKQHSQKFSKDHDLKEKILEGPETADTVGHILPDNLRTNNEIILTKSSNEKNINKANPNNVSENKFIVSNNKQILSTEPPANKKFKIGKNETRAKFDSNSSHFVLKRKAAKKQTDGECLMTQYFYSSSVEDFKAKYPKINTNEEKIRWGNFFDEMSPKYNKICLYIRQMLDDTVKMVETTKGSEKARQIMLWKKKHQEKIQVSIRAEIMQQKLNHIKNIYRKYEKH